MILRVAMDVLCSMNRYQYK